LFYTYLYTLDTSVHVYMYEALSTHHVVTILTL
jgi:hypothetical protein